MLQTGLRFSQSLDERLSVGLTVEDYLNASFNKEANFLETLFFFDEKISSSLSAYRMTLNSGFMR